MLPVVHVLHYNPSHDSLCPPLPCLFSRFPTFIKSFSAIVRLSACCDHPCILSFPVCEKASESASTTARLGSFRLIATASSHTAMINNYLAKKRACGRLGGPIRSEARSPMHLSPFGVIPKSNQPGRWRLIVDLSFPHSQRVSDGILLALASLRFIRIDDVGFCPPSGVLLTLRDCV